MTIKIMMGDDRIDALEWRFCISGQTIKPLSMQNPASDWIEANTWTEILSLGGLSDVFAEHLFGYFLLRGAGLFFRNCFLSENLLLVGTNVRNCVFLENIKNTP